MCCASIFADRDERNDRPTRQYINNTGGVVVTGRVVRDRQIHVGATSLNRDTVVVFKNILKVKFTFH